MLLSHDTRVFIRVTINIFRHNLMDTTAKGVDSSSYGVFTGFINLRGSVLEIILDIRHGKT